MLVWRLLYDRDYRNYSWRLDRRCLPSLEDVARPQANKSSRRLDEADPLALLNQAVDDGVASIQNAKKGLENYRVLILSVQRQVENGEKEKARLEARIREALEAGDPNRTAQEYAMMLADVEAEHRGQPRAIAAAQGNLRELRQAGRSRPEPRSRGPAKGHAAWAWNWSKASAKRRWPASPATSPSIPHGLDTDLARAEELIYQKIDANRAVGHVAEDLSKPIIAESVDEDKERKAAASKILERFTKEPPTKQSQ